MTKSIKHTIFIGAILLFVFYPSNVLSTQETNTLFNDIRLSEKQAEEIADKIFYNECGSLPSCIISWNEGEAFPSLGIGHFIWYPKNIRAPFFESFPELIRYMRSKSITIPKLINENTPFTPPWTSRRIFLSEQSQQSINLYRNFLLSTKPTQLSFMFHRAKLSWGEIIHAAPQQKKLKIKKVIRLMLLEKNGLYALIDYVNFKGEGLLKTERYKNQGWGLYQVLEETQPKPSQSIVTSFQQAAKKVLTQRANNAPHAIEKGKWLRIWHQRLDTY